MLKVLTRIRHSALLGVVLLSQVSALSQTPPLTQGRMAASGSVEGTVLDAETDQPLQNAEVALMSVNSAPQKITVDPQGRFRFEAVKPGHYDLVPTKAGYVFWLKSSGTFDQIGRSITVSDSGKDLKAVELRLARTAVISGRVLDVAGSPLPKSQVSLKRQIYGEDGILTLVAATNLTTTDDRGEYRIPNVAPAEYRLVFGGPPFSSGKLAITTYYRGATDSFAAEPVIVKPGDELRLADIVQNQALGTPLRFHLIGNDNGPSSTVKIYLRETAYNTRASREDPELLEINAVLPGRLEAFVSWRSPKGTAYNLVDLNVGTSAIDQVLFPQIANQVTIQLKKRDAAGKLEPATGVGCRLRSNFLLELCAATNLILPNDQYQIELRNVPSGMHIVEVTGPSGAVLSDVIPVVGSGTFQVILSDVGAVVHGAVTEESGQSVPDAVVALIPDEPLRGIGYLYRSTVSDVGGGFELTGVAPGSYHLFAWPRTSGAAFKNKDFIKKYQSAGKAVTIRNTEAISTDIAVAN
jgi:uncharacterized surface anchored protein